MNFEKEQPDCLNSVCTCFQAKKFQTPTYFNSEDTLQYILVNKQWLEHYIDEIIKHQRKDLLNFTQEYDFAEAFTIVTSLHHLNQTLYKFEKKFLQQKINDYNSSNSGILRLSDLYNHIDKIS